MSSSKLSKRRPFKDSEIKAYINEIAYKALDRFNAGANAVRFLDDHEGLLTIRQRTRLFVTRPGKPRFNSSLTARDFIREKLQRSFRITRYHFSGTLTSVFWEFCSASHQEQQYFEDAWYGLFSENSTMAEFAGRVRLGHQELWYIRP